MVNKINILLVEDEVGVGNFIEKTLIREGYKVVCAKTGREALSQITSQCLDVILLDMGLPDMDGFEIVRNVREWSSIPIIVVSGRNEEYEKVKALDAGVDDYITKPFGTKELLARIRTAYRHSVYIESGVTASTYIFRTGGLEINLKQRSVTMNGDDIHFTQIEFKILTLLVKNVGKVLTYETIKREIWGPLAMKENQILRVNMANIRRKIEVNPANPKYIFTEVGVGYRLLEEVSINEVNI